MLQEIDTDIVDFYGFPYPMRAVVVRLPTGELWGWSPIALSEALRAAVDARGPVGHLISPNKLHHLYLGQWARAYPAARLWGPAATVRRCWTGSRRGPSWPTAFGRRATAPPICARRSPG